MGQSLDEWNELKKTLDSNKRLVTFQERQIWWCSVGMNIGSEVYGKNELYSRPVLIVRKFSQRCFFGVPMTSNCEIRPNHFPTFFKGKHGCAKLEQLRYFDSKRLVRLMGYLPDDQYNSIREALADLFRK